MGSSTEHMNIHLLKVLLPMLKDEQNLSKCSNGKVAAIITSPNFDTVYSVGHNGGTPLMPCLCAAGDKYKCLHAEINALLNTCIRGPAVMLVSKAPCVSCAAAIVNAGIKHVYYLDDYSCTAGLDLLAAHKIGTTKISIGGE